MNQSEMKFRMSMGEMYVAFAAAHPEYTPNKKNVGMFARSMGYKKVKQVINYRQTYFYVNPSLRDNG